VKKIATPEEKHRALHIGHRMSSSETASTLAALYSRERYENIVEKLSNLSPGIDLFATVEKLEGNIIANHGGVEITFIIQGFLNYKGQYRFAKMTSNGIYNIMPFGYVENGQEIPKTALIFKNGILHEIVPYSTRKQIEETLN
jgi:hypothetical protein